jgi:hypothetical protein
MMVKFLSIKKALKVYPISWPDILFSTIFTIVLVSGYILSTYESIDATHFGRSSVLAYLCGSIVIWVLSLFILVTIKQWCLKKKKGTTTEFLENISDKKFRIIMFAIIFTCYIPVILACFSVLSPDSWSSVGQSTGVTPLSNANPLIFTALVSIFINIGLWFGSLEFGTLLFSIAQSAILAMIFAQIIVWMRREKISKIAIIATLVFYAILPINAFAGVIMWKDILFAGFGLLLLLFLRQLYLEKNRFFTNKKQIIYFVLFAFLFCIWRNNGVYAYILFLILAIAINYKTFLKTKYLLLLLAPVLLYIIYMTFISTITKPTSQSDAMLSIPLQQVARTVKYHEKSISSQDKETLNEILLFNQLGQKYNPNLSDPVKGLLDTEAYNANREKYMNLWFKLYMEHKKTYVAAFLYNTYGYVYPFYTSTTITDVVIDNASPPNAQKGYSDSAYKNGGKIVAAKYRDLLTSLAPFMHNVGFYTCIILLGAYISIIKKRKELVGVFVVLFCLFVTTILGPVNGEFRYLYLFVIATPFIIAAVCSDYSSRGVKKSHG